jgi:hypothetical protein
MVSYHRFQIGQTVIAFRGESLIPIPRGPYVITRLLPFVGRDPHYRVKSEVDGHERALLEPQMQAVSPPEPLTADGKAKR